MEVGSTAFRHRVKSIGSVVVMEIRAWNMQYMHEVKNMQDVKMVKTTTIVSEKDLKDLA